MERERPFSFKLLVPPRISIGQVSAVRPQEIVEDKGDRVQTLPGFCKSTENEVIAPFPNTNMVLPSKHTRADAAKKVAVLPMEKEEKTWKSNELYSKLFEEAEKIKRWKVKTESELMKKDQILQEHKRTLESQRKAIQELQFANESLSMKLEDKITENEDLQNKSTATRNLCNILKDAFEQITEKMALYESEREETHQLFMQNKSTIENMVNAFENLHIQADANRQDVLKVKEELQEMEACKEQFQLKFKQKQEEAAVLQAKLASKDNELQNFVQHIQDAEQNYFQLQETAMENYKLLKASEKEQELLIEKLQSTEKSHQECEDKQKAVQASLEHIEKTLSEKERVLEDIRKTHGENLEQLANVQAKYAESEVALSAEKQRTNDLEEAKSCLFNELKLKNSELGELKEHKEEKEGELEKLQEKMEVHLKSLEILEKKVTMEEYKVAQLTLELEAKKAEVDELGNEVNIAGAGKKYAEEVLENTRKEFEDMKAKLSEVGTQLSNAQVDEVRASSEIKQLKKDAEENKQRYQELMLSFNKLQLERETLAQQESSEALNIHLQESKAQERQAKKEIQRLQEENQQQRDDIISLKAVIHKHQEDMKKILQEHEVSNQAQQKDLIKKEKQLKSLEIKLNVCKTKIDNKIKAHEEYLKESKCLKKQLALENENCCQLETEVNELKVKLNNVQRLKEEELNRIHSDLEARIITEAELHKKMQELNIIALEASKSKEEAELKCQHKISDMVALMEKHKNQYDKMVAEKDVELDDRRQKEAEIIATKTSLELELSEVKIEKSRLKEQLESELTEMESLKQEVVTLKKRMKSLKESATETTAESNPKGTRYPASQKYTQKSKGSLGRSVFDFSREAESENVDVTLCQSIFNELVSPPPKEAESKLQKAVITPVRKVSSSRIKSYRICTPPSADKTGSLGKNILELDPKSDSSEQTDLLSFSVEAKTLKDILPENQSRKDPYYGRVFRKLQSPVVSKQSGTALRQAAVKRMRDAGWTAVTDGDKRKKKASEKIFA